MHVCTDMAKNLLAQLLALVREIQTSCPESRTMLEGIESACEKGVKNCHLRDTLNEIADRTYKLNPDLFECETLLAKLTQEFGILQPIGCRTQGSSDVYVTVDVTLLDVVMNNLVSFWAQVRTQEG